MILDSCDIPIVLAPLAGGPSTPELVSFTFGIPAGLADYVNLWAGQAYPLTATAPAAADLVRELWDQARAALGQAAGRYL